MVDPDSLERIYSSIGQYIDPITGEDLTLQAAIYVANELEKQGITNFSQIETRFIPAQEEYRYDRDADAYDYFTVADAQTKYYNKATGKEINPVLFDDKAGTKYTLTDQGLQKDFDPIQKLAVQLRPYVDPSSTGGAWSTKSGESSGPGFGPEGMLRQLAQSFFNRTGLTDLNKLGVRTTTEYHEAGNMVYVPVSVTTYYNKDTGRDIGFNGDLGGWGEGPGFTYANILFDDDGKPRIRTWGQDTNTLSDLGPILAIASLVPSPIQPFAIAANAAIALDQGDVLGAVASVAGLAGLKEVAAVAKVAKAVESGDILGAALAAATASGAGNVQLADGISVNDVLKVAKAADAISKGDFGTALVLAGQQFGSQELVKAGQGVQLAKAVASGNPNAIVNAAGQVMSAYSSDAANAAAKNEGWTGLSEKNTAINFYGPNVTPDQWNRLGQYIDYSTGEDNLANSYKSLFGRSQAYDQFYEFGLDPNEFKRIDTIDDALKAGQSAFISAAIDAYGKGTMSESELRSELRAAGISDSNTSTLVNVAKDSAAKQERVNTVFRDLLDPGSDLSLEGAAVRLKEAGLTDTQVSSAIQSITNDFSKASELRTRTDQIIDDYTAWNSDLSREKALERLVTAGVGATRANELLGLVDTQVESQRYLKEVGREAVQRYAAGDISREDAELALQKGSFPVQTVKTMIEYANAIKEGRQLTPGEMEVAAANNLNQWFNVGSGYQVRVARAEDGTIGLVEARDPLGRDVTRDIFLDPKTNTLTVIASIPKTVSKAIDDPRMYRGFDTSIYVPDIVGRLGLPPGTASNNEVIALINEWNAATPTERRQLAKDPLMQGLKMINDEKLKSAEVPWRQVASKIINESSGSLTSGLSNWALAGQDLAKAIQDTESLITGKPPGEVSAWFNRTGAEMLNAVSGVLAYGGSKSLAPDLKQASDIIRGIGGENSEIAASIKDFTERLDSIPDWRDKAYEAAAFTYKDPVAVLSWALSEVAQDGPAMLAYGLAKAGKLTAASLASGLETLGGAYWDAREAALNENKSITEANNLANKAATQAAAATLAIGGAFDAKSIKALDDFRAGRITQQTAKGILGEAFDEGTTNLLVQATATGRIDPSKLGTAAITGGLIGGVAGGKTASINEGVMGNVTVLALNPANNTAVLMNDKFEPYVVSMENRNLQLGQSYLFNPSNFLVQQQINDAIASNMPLSEVISDQIANAIAVDAPLSIVTQGIFDSDAVKANPVNGVTETINAAFANNINPDSILASVLNSALDIYGPTDQQIIDAAIGSMLAAGRSIEDATRSLVNASINSGLSYNTALNDVTSSLLAKSTDPAATLGQIIPIASQVGLTAGQTPADVANAVFNTALQAGKTANLNATDTLSNAINQTYNSLIAGGLTPDQASIILGSAASQSGASNNLTTADVLTSINTGITQAGGNTQLATANIVSGQLTGLQTQYNQLSANQKQIADNLVAQGITLQDAITRAKSDLSTEIGEVKTDLQTKYDALTASQKQIADDLIDQGKTLQEAIDQAVSQLGTEIGGVKTEIGEVKTDFQTKYDALTQTQKEQFDALTQSQKDLATQLATQGTDLATAINTVKTELKTEIGDVKTGLETQIGDIKTQIGNKIDALAKTSADADQVLKGSIDSVAADLGLTRDQLLTQLGTTEANLKTEFKTQLDTVQTALQQQIQQQTEQIKQQTAQQKEDARLQRIATGSAAALAMPGLMGQATKQPFIESPSLKSEVTGGIEDPLAKFMKIIQGEPQTAPEVPQPPLGGDMSNTFTYGKQPPSYDELFSNQEFAEDPDFVNREELILPYKAGGSPLNIQMMYAKGGEPREDFRDGKHVAGPGDGQSDDIPAWLADGEFVFPADVVSALGNGSTKAGTEKLYDMMHAIRKRARSKGPKDLPPAALKSPLDYLKG